jgi:hypothetical protein
MIESCSQAHISWLKQERHKESRRHILWRNNILQIRYIILDHLFSKNKSKENVDDVLCELTWVVFAILKIFASLISFKSGLHSIKVI